MLLALPVPAHSPLHMSVSSGRAVFLSYASQDGGAARRICDTLREAGVEVWLDEDELVGGDSWDQKIRGQIRACALFVPLISAGSQARREGYFRLEWKLAAQRTHAIADGTPFLLPVVIDATRDTEALVPEEFRAAQWTRISAGDVPPAFTQRVRTLLGLDPAPAAQPAASLDTQEKVRATQPTRRPLLLAGAAGAILAAVAIVIFETRKPVPPAPPPAQSADPLPETPVLTEKSIAILPFENLSPDKENEFFADGMHDEVITTLSKIHELTVIARASVIEYRAAEKRNLRQIAAALGVAHVLEGRVRRAGNQVKVTVELIHARTGKLLWTNPYTEELTNHFAIQAKLAAAITTELKTTLTPQEQSLIARRPTLNQDAYDLYLRARGWREMKLTGPGSLETEASWEEFAVAPLTKATQLDPEFVAAFAELGLVHGTFYRRVQSQRTPARLAKAKEAIDTALRLDPASPAAHLALGAYYYFGPNDYARATEELTIALAAMPGDADVLQHLSTAQRRLGRWAEGAANCERAYKINPRNKIIVQDWVGFLLMQRSYARAERAAEQALALDPANNSVRIQKVTAQFAQDGDRARFQSELYSIELASGERTPRQVDFRRAVQDRRFSDAVRIYDAAREPLMPIVRSIPDPLFEYLHAVAAGGDFEKVRATARAAIEVNKKAAVVAEDEWRLIAVSALLHAYAGLEREARQLAGRVLELMPMSRDAVAGPNALRNAALVHVVLNDHDRALALLAEALSVPSGLVANIILYLEPWWEPLHHDPRFKAALAQAAPRN